MEKEKNWNREQLDKHKKEKELAIISTDEYKKRNLELQKEIREKDKKIQELNKVIENQKQRLNDYIVKEEMQQNIKEMDGVDNA